MVSKRIVCLANSRKLSGRCIAGKVVQSPHEWVRPVSAREHQEVSEHERHYSDGKDPVVLDIIDVPLKGHQPRTYQQENWLLDPDRYWTKVGTASWDDLLRMQDAPDILWLNKDETRTGLRDKITLENAELLDSSLMLIHVPSLELKVLTPGAAFGNFKKRTQGRFRYGRQDYWLWVTDPNIEREMHAGNGDKQLGECLLTVSLGEPFNNDVYKLIAAVIPRSS